MSEKTLGKARGLNSIADPSDYKGSGGRRGRGRGKEAQTQPLETPAAEAMPTNESGDSAPTTPHRAVVPGVQRTRRELSVPVPIAEAVEKTGINPADVVMSAYRKHGDAVYTGSGGRLVSRGRRRLRLSISDTEFDKLTRLGQARGWNRSETVAVLLALELLPAETLTD